MIPADARLTPRDPAFPAWESVPADLKTLYARQMEVFAGFQENCDHEIGRVVQSIEDLGIADDTMIVYIWGDNGSSMEGTETGSFNEMTTLNGVDVPAKEQLKLIQAYGGIEGWGGPSSQPHFACAWAWAGNTPFQWGKQVASHFGGTRDPMVVSWPGRIKDKGGLREQFTHCTDIVPTILDCAGIAPPKSVDGIEQMPMHGVSFANTFDDARGQGPPHPAILRDLRQPRHVQGRLDRLRPAGPDPLGGRPRGAREVRPQGGLGPGQGQVGALQHRRGLLPGERPGGRAPGEAGRAEEAVLGGGREDTTSRR